MASTATARTAPRHGRSRSSAAPARRRPEPAHRPRRAPARPAADRGTARGNALRFVEARTSGLLDRLLRGRLWVGCIGALLAGIVFLNVSLLELNQDIARTSAKAGTLDRQNSALRDRLAALDSTDRIQRIALRRGMVLPPAGAFRYLTARPGDGRLAAQRATTPNGAGATATAAAASTTARTYQPAAAASARRTYASPATATASPTRTTTAPSATTPPTAAAPVAGQR